LHDENIRRSLDLTNWEAATKKIRDWEIHGRKNIISVSDAYDRFIAQHEANGSALGTVQKHRLLKRESLEFFGDVPVRSLTVDDVSRFRESWTVGLQTTTYKIGRVRSFFKFCVEREWVEKSPAKSLKLPKIDEIEVKPYKAEELQKIIKAIDKFPNWGIYGEKNRDRVRAFVAVLRWTGMRIGDAVQLDASKIVDGQVILRTEKNGKRVSIPAHPEITSALLKMNKSGYFFWSGESTVHSAVTDWWRTLKRLGQVAHIHVTAHKFRHTLAAELISAGVPIAQVAAILGNSPRIVEKHYSQFIEQRQMALDAAVKGTW
jgi:integrase